MYGFTDGVGYLLGSLSVFDCFWVQNSCVQKTLLLKKKQDVKDKHALREGKGHVDGPVTKNRGPNNNRKGSKTALSLPKKL